MSDRQSTEEETRKDERDRINDLHSRVRGVSITREFMTCLLNPKGRRITTDLPDDLEVISIHQGMIVRGFVLYCRSKEFPKLAPGHEAPIDLVPTITDHGGGEIVTDTEADEPFEAGDVVNADDATEVKHCRTYGDGEDIEVPVECGVCARRQGVTVQNGPDFPTPDLILRALEFDCECGNKYRWDGKFGGLEGCLYGIQAQVFSTSTLPPEAYKALVAGDDMPTKPQER